MRLGKSMGSEKLSAALGGRKIEVKQVLEGSWVWEGSAVQCLLWAWRNKAGSVENTHGIQKLDPSSINSLQGTGTQSSNHKALKFASLLEPEDSPLARDIKDSTHLVQCVAPNSKPSWATLPLASDSHRSDVRVSDFCLKQLSLC